MRNFLPLFLALTAVFSFTKAQHIPDANFAAAIRQQYPNCIDASDNLLPAAANLANLNVSNRSITDLTGLSGFTSLRVLNCSNNQLAVLPILPNTLRSLYCSGNQLQTLSNLFDSLSYIDCSQNMISSISNLPINLYEFRCAGNQLSSLPLLPNNLELFDCSNNQFANLPGLPNELEYLACGDNFLTNLPNLPDSLRELHCQYNQINQLPTLPNGLDFLECQFNQLLTLTNLPNSLTYVDCSANQLISLANIPNNLVVLYCGYNQLNNLPISGSSLRELSCQNNLFQYLPILPFTLTYLDCSDNQIDSLPHLLPDLTYLDCANNLLYSLPDLPATLQSLNCSNNQITLIPFLPLGLMILYCDDNPNLTCLPELPPVLNALTTQNTLITCIANRPVNLSSGLPVCNPSNNIYNCFMYNQAHGRVFYDINANGVFDTLIDYPAFNRLILSNNTFAGATDANGYYYLGLAFDTTNIITLSNFFNPNYCSVSPSSYTVITNNNTQIFSNNDFIIVPTQGVFDDLSVEILAGNYRQGLNFITLVVENKGFTMLSGNLSLNLDSDVSFVSSSFPYLQTGQNLSFSFTNLEPFEIRRILIEMYVDTAVTTLGMNISHTLTGNILNDTDLSNNQSTSSGEVIGAYDPNDINADKDALCSNYSWELEEYLTYTIRFQNTGNSYAQNVWVGDTLSSFLDIATFQQIAASHNYRLVFDNIFDNGSHKIVVKWHFDNIMLLDSSINEALSHGYIKYKIKPRVASLFNRNEIITSQAHIYFDFNPAVNTNIDEIRSEICIGVNQSASETVEKTFQIFPNPNKGSFSLRFANDVNLENANLYIYNHLGELVAQYKINNQTQQVETNNLPAAAYIVKVQAKNATFVQKMIVE